MWPLTVVTREIKHWNNFKIISEQFYFTCNHGVIVCHCVYFVGSNCIARSQEWRWMRRVWQKIFQRIATVTYLPVCSIIVNIIIINLALVLCKMAVNRWQILWIIDVEICRIIDCIIVRSGHGQATYTRVPLSPSSIIWYRPRRVIFLAGKVTAGLVESNGSLPPGL